MKKLAVLTAVVFLFGVAGIAAAFQPGGFNQDPLIEANNNDLVKGGAAANDQSLAVNDSLNNNDIANDSVKGGAAANDQSIATNDSLNNNDLFSNNETAAASNGGQATVDGNNTKVEADKGGQAANNGGTNVSQKAFAIVNELPGSGDSYDYSQANPDSSVGDKSIGANSADAKNFSDNPEADDGSQLLQGGGTQTMNKADDGGIVATGSNNSFTKNEADKGGMINTGEGNLNKVTNEGKYAAQNASQDIKETNVKADGFGNIAAYGDVLTMKAEKGGVAVGPGSAASFTEMKGEVKGNFITFGYNEANAKADSGDADTGKNDSGWAFTGKADSGDADTGKNDSGSAFSLSASKSKSGAAGAAAFGESKAYGNNAGALGGSKSKSDADAVAVDAISLFGGADADADSDSKSFSANVAVAKDGDSKNYSKADADSGSSNSKSKADATSGNVASGAATSGYADSGDAESGYVASGAATSGAATATAGTITNSFATGANTMSAVSFNGLGNFHMDSSVGSLTQQSINVNAVVGGNAFGN
jgi:hypothetical protein